MGAGTVPPYLFGSQGLLDSLGNFFNWDITQGNNVILFEVHYNGWFPAEVELRGVAVFLGCFFADSITFSILISGFQHLGAGEGKPVLDFPSFVSEAVWVINPFNSVQTGVFGG
jgi:hypothetical protein